MVNDDDDDNDDDEQQEVIVKYRNKKHKIGCKHFRASKQNGYKTDNCVSGFIA